MSVWKLAYEGFDPKQEGLREALHTLGNGFFATRGAAPEARADGVHYPGTYVAGGYNRLATEIADRTVENESLVNLPNWLHLSFRIEDGDPFDVRQVELLEYRQELDLKQAVLTRRLRFQDDAGRRTRLVQRRFVHMREPHLAGLESTWTAENWSGRLVVTSGLDGRVENTGVARYRDLDSRHLEPLGTHAANDGETVCLEVRTNQSHIRIGESARARLWRNGEPVAAKRRLLEEPGYVAQEITVDLAEGEPVTLEKIVALYTSRDPAIGDAHEDACRKVRRAGRFDDLLASHVLHWDHLWQRFGLALEDAEDAAGILNVHVFHLLQTVSPNTIDLDVGVPARGLHGEAYRGHIFWDELFIFPFINFRLPQLTRALLLYRYRRLPEARWLARTAGYEGAMYPWQSGSDGREETQTLHLNPRSGRWLPDPSRLQRHINIAIAYNIWQYYQVSGDLDFLCFYGAEMLLEIARFWSSIATYDRARDRYVIRGVMGPDEYQERYPGADEPGIDNNAYTNVMAAWVLRRALELVELLPEPHRRETWEDLGLRREELERWEEITRKMFVPFHGDGILSQFEGYEELEEFDWAGYRKKYGDIQRLDRILEAEGDTPSRYKASKQADALMLFYLLSAEELQDLFERLDYPFDPAWIPKNIDYYLHRTSHGSTLSAVVHAWVLARADRERSWHFFTRALRSDVADIQGGTTPEGIHLGAMAGTVDLVQGCYTGLEARGDVLWLNPALPAPLHKLELNVAYRGQWLELSVTPERLTIRTCPGVCAPVKIGVRDEVFELPPGTTKEIKLESTVDSRQSTG